MRLGAKLQASGPQLKCSFDHLVGIRDQSRRHLDAERSIDGELESAGLHLPEGRLAWRP
jgi:hypothetical protein